MIDTRDELVSALREASEIEHGLLVQYLFAALTLKKHQREGLTAPQQSLVREWEQTLLRVAVEEMGHLGTVSNLLTSIGAAPHFARPNFPKETGYYPFPFDLMPFSDDSLWRFQVFELPKGLEPPTRRLALGDGFEFVAVAPDPLVYSRVGELYQQIRDGVAAIAERELFIGPADAQATTRWSVDLDLRQVTDRSSAFAAIDDIIVDGEGTPDGNASSHYGRFTEIRLAYNRLGCFDAARRVVTNPRTRHHRDADGEGELITDPLAIKVAELFNGAYALMLALLDQYFRGGGESASQRDVIRSAAARMMSVALRPLAEVLTELPAKNDPQDPRRAAPGFELYDIVSTPPQPSARWITTLERFDAIASAGDEIAGDVPRVRAIIETMSYIRRSLLLASKE